ncbi:MAG: hypothetical protein OEZ57_01260 [Nitrospirota bacterium]|nr:hypothetical protein [Nitrospirota bacterium]MDH5585249.1 hypothetical protein [Nitrospirota bacterium]MDH5773528.1 hypothetical protein [Nitrospirota bacterium]
MRQSKTRILLTLTGACISWWMAGLSPALADTTVTLEQPVHFFNAEGSDVALAAGQYELALADTWLRVTTSGGQTVDALLLEAQSATHDESLTEPLAISTQGESPDVHHLALLLPGGKRLEAIGSYSGLRSRGTLSLLSIQRLKTLSSTKSTASTEYSTPVFGGGGGTNSYNLDCGGGSIMVGAIYKSGSWLDALGIICQRVNSQTGFLGDEFTRGPVGGVGGTAKTSRCPQGQAVQGIVVRSGQFVNGGTFFCRDWLTAQKQPRYSTTVHCEEGTCRSFGSGSGGYNESFFCPSGKVGKAFRGRYGWYIDSTRFVCDTWDK